MQLLTGYHLGALFFVLVLSAFVLLPCILVMHALMPKAVLERYWRTPYFRPAELALFTDTVYAPMRTVMLIGAIAFPQWGRKRNVTEAHTLVPPWYRFASRALCVWIIGALAGSGLIVLLVFIASHMGGNPVSL